MSELVTRLRPKKSELMLGALFGLVSLIVIVALLSRGRVLAGAESQVGADQLQYLSWIVTGGQNGSILSWWSIPPQTSSWFVHPGFLISGLLNRAGLGIVLSYQVWKLVAIPAVVIAFAAYVRRTLPEGGPRTAALALALFGLSPVGAVIGWNTLGKGLSAQVEFASGELFAPSWLWGYMMTALAVALMVVGLLLAESSTRVGAGIGVKVSAVAAAFFCSWLQPWQGAELLGAVLITDVLVRSQRSNRLSRQFLSRLPLVLGALIPLVYYRWLSESEAVWKIAATANNEVPLWSVGVWVAVLLPWSPALLAYGRRGNGWQDIALRVVPLLMLAEYVVISVSRAGTFPFHAVQGLTLFLAVLAVQGLLLLRDQAWWKLHLPLAGLLVGLLCVPGTAHRVNLMRLEIHRSAQPYFLERGEADALAQLRSAPGEGGVLAPIKAALSVPAHSHRPVWVGQLSWTPNFRDRVAQAESLFKGQLTVGQARQLVERSGARFLYSDCGHPFDLSEVFKERVLRVTEHGCARIYELKAKP